jgi:hypothetical protein
MSACIVAGLMLRSAWIAFDDPRRPGGNSGHTTVDFGGQWVIGRMLVAGKGHALYHRLEQRPILEAGYPEGDEVPDEEREPDERGKHEADQLMTWFMGQDAPAGIAATTAQVLPLASTDCLTAFVNLHLARIDLSARAIGGPLYPPVHAVFMYPLGLLTPWQAYRAIQILSITLALVAAWGIMLLAENRIWWPVAWIGILLYPGYAGALFLGQNAIVTLTILVLGWAWLARQRPTLAGVSWGLLAFKPVWAVVFFLLLVLTRRWRSCLAMGATSLVLILITLPTVGLQGWLDWLKVGRMATALYQTDENWIFLSRDLISIPRRWLVDWTGDHAVALEPAASIAGWAILVAVLEPTIRLAAVRRKALAETTGPAAAFLLLGTWFCCFHFMYYDVLLTALPLFMLLTTPGEYLIPHAFACVALDPKEKKHTLHRYLAPRLARIYPMSRNELGYGVGNIYVRNSMTLTLIVLFLVAALLLPGLNVAVTVAFALLEHSALPHRLQYSTALKGTPWEIACLLAIWLWCAWRWLREKCP